MSSGEIWSVALATALWAIVALVVGVLIRRAWHAWLASRADETRGRAYRELAEAVAKAQAAQAEAQRRTAAELAEIRASIENVERVLREVE